MKKVTLILSCLLLMSLFFQSCTKDDLSTPQTTLTESTVESPVLEQRGESDCERLEKELDLLLPDTKEEVAFVESIEDPTKLTKRQIEAYGEVLGFSSLEAFQEYFLQFLKSDCDFSNEERGQLERLGDCEDSWDDCVDFSIDLAVDYLLGGASFDQVFDGLISNVMYCNSEYLNCKD